MKKLAFLLFFFCLMSKMNAWLGEIMKAGNGKIIGIVLTSGLRCV